MRRALWWLAELLSQALSPGEQHAVMGDLSESGVSGIRALCDVFGLVIRRQLAPWSDWRPWLGLFGLALPVGILLTLNTFMIDGAADLYLWIARNYATIDPTTLEPGLTLRYGFIRIVAGSLLVACSSWIAGIALGRLSRGAISVNRVAFCLTPACLALVTIARPRVYAYSVAGWIFPQRFYTVLIPVLLLTALVIIPSLRGISRSRRFPITELRGQVLAAASIVALASIIQPFWAGAPRVLAFVGYAGYWPVGYVMSISRKRRGWT
ncbi:MAG TPA: hypothetical protein VHA14_05050 [Bryobacteraceae bacterium]|nr:hypothetical protein [Bryobacteraceae bacterium]